MIYRIIQLIFALAVMLVGARLIGWWAVGIVLVAFGLLIAGDALLRDDIVHRRKNQPSNEVLERYRRAR